MRTWRRQRTCGSCRATPISGLILPEKALQFCCRLHGEESADDFKASQGWLLDQVSGAEASSDHISSEEPEGEPGGALLPAELRHAGFSSVDEAVVQEGLNVDRNKPGYTALTEKEIVPAVSRLD